MVWVVLDLGFFFFTTEWHHWFILILGSPVNIVNFNPVFQSSGRLSRPCYLHLTTCALPSASHQWWIFRAMVSRVVCAALFDSSLQFGNVQVNNLQAKFCLSDMVVWHTPSFPLFAYKNIRAAFNVLSQSLLFYYKKKLDWFDIICSEQIHVGCS